MHRLPNLVANISIQLHHLVNTGLAVGSLVKWLPIKVAHTCKLDTIWDGLLLTDWKWLHPIVITFNTLHMPSGILHTMMCGTSVNSLALIHTTINLFLPCKLIFLKSYQYWLPSKLSKADISVMGNLSTTILCHIIIRPILNILLKT